MLLKIKRQALKTIDPETPNEGADSKFSCQLHATLEITTSVLLQWLLYAWRGQRFLGGGGGMVYWQVGPDMRLLALSVPVIGYVVVCLPSFHQHYVLR